MLEHADDSATPLPCPYPDCGESLMLEPYQSVVPIPGRAAKAAVHPRCGRAWTRKYAPQRAAHALAQLAGAILARDEDILPTTDEAEQVLTIELAAALGPVTDRVTVTPGHDGTLRYWWLSLRPSLRPDPPQMTPGSLCSLPGEMAARMVDRLMLGITTPAP